jgi:hypothetical protein
MIPVRRTPPLYMAYYPEWNHENAGSTPSLITIRSILTWEEPYWTRLQMETP